MKTCTAFVTTNASGDRSRKEVLDTFRDVSHFTINQCGCLVITCESAKRSHIYAPGVWTHFEIEEDE